MPGFAEGNIVRAFSGGNKQSRTYRVTKTDKQGNIVSMLERWFNDKSNALVESKTERQPDKGKPVTLLGATGPAIGSVDAKHRHAAEEKQNA